MTARLSLTLAALCVVSEHWFGLTWTEADGERRLVSLALTALELHVAARVLRFLPHVECAVGDRAVAVLGEASGWWRVGGVRVGFDLFFDTLPLRGVPIDPERAWYEVADFLGPLTLNILFWDAAVSSWWLFAPTTRERRKSQWC